MKSGAQLKAVYTVAEMAEMAGMTHKRMVKLLGDAGILKPSVGRGRERVVCLSQLKGAWPDLWDSIVLKAFAESQE